MHEGIIWLQSRRLDYVACSFPVEIISVKAQQVIHHVKNKQL